MYGEDEARFDDPEHLEDEELPMPEPPGEIALPRPAWGWMTPFFGTMRPPHHPPAPEDPEAEMERQRAEAEEYLSMN